MFDTLIQIFVFGVVILFFVGIIKGFRIVPQQNAYVVERFGRYHKTLSAGPHVLIPFFDTVRYKHNLKEISLDIPEQICITKDNVQVGVDGVLFFRLIDPYKASYGIANFVFAIQQLAQTTLRSEIGKIDLDRTFEEREIINNAIVMAIDKATDAWGVKVLRYEIKSITPPRDVVEAMEKQMRAEREKRAKILESEGDRDSKINRAEGLKQEAIKNSEATKQKSINEAQGQAEAILSIAQATANGLKMVSDVLASPGGKDAAKLRVAEEYIQQFGKLAKTSNTMIVPATASDISGMIATAFTVFEKMKPQAAE